MNMRVISVVMGGGRGTRLQPLTKLRCKPAVPLAGKYRLVDIPISNCLNSGLNQIYLLTQFNTASLHRHIRESYAFDSFGGGFVDILSAEQTEAGENWYQGTSDAVRQNLRHFHAGEDDLFLIVSGDQLYHMDFRTIIEQHQRTGAEVTIAGKVVPESEAGKFGIMRVDDHLRITEFFEKPTSPEVVQSLRLSEKLRQYVRDPGAGEGCLASMGIYLFNKSVLFDALEQSSADDFGHEVIPSLLGRISLYVFVFDDYWEDIGTVRAFFEANLRLTDPVPPYDFYDPDHVVYTHARFLPASKLNRCSIDRAVVADGCTMTDAVIRRSVIGLRSVVREGSTLENVVVMGGDFFETEADLARNRATGVPDIGIGRNCHISDAIIDKNARIGANVRLSPRVKPDLFEGDGVMVRDGVLVVLKEAIVPDNTII